MIMNDPTSPFSAQSECCYDTLVVSQDRTLFTQFRAFLSEFEPERKPFLADDLTTFPTMVQNLSQCDVMICDMRSNYSSIELGAYAMDCVPPETLTIGLTSEFECSHEALSRQQNLRFSGIIDNHKGWLSNWNQIAAIRQALHNPLMVSRIEEVPVSDVLQMISSGRWSVVVHITGYLPTQPDQPHKGCISFYQGEPQTAWSWTSAGVPAMFDLLSLKRGILQIVKNVCTPTIRNIYLQTDEILLAHAVALDESIIPASVKPLAKPDFIPPPAPAEASLINEPSRRQPSVEAPERRKTTWWSENGSRLVASIAEASPQTFPVRWMSGDEITRMVRSQSGAAALVVYGSDATLSAFFSACARGFSTGKMTDVNLFAVMRLGRSHEQCLYIAGCRPDAAITFDRAVPAVIFGYPGINEETIDRVRSRNHTALLAVGGHDLDNLIKEAFAPADHRSPVTHLAAGDMSWKHLTALLQSAISTLMTIE